MQRKPGVPSESNPRTGLYKELIDAGEDLVSLHALMAPRPVLVSGGTEDPPRNWQALNHLLEVNRLLGYENRAAMTARSTHVPTPEALDRNGLDLTEDGLKQCLKVDPAEWIEAASGQAEFFGKFGGRLPAGMRDEHQNLMRRIQPYLSDDNQTAD